MSIADYVILGVLALSMGLSLYRGFALEALSLVTWISSFIIARLFSVPLAVLMGDWIEPPSARQPIAFVMLIIMTLIVGALIKHLVKEVIKATGLSGTDRVLGSAFGLIRGCLLIVIALSVMASITQMPADPWWKSSVLIPHFLLIEEWTTDIGQQIWQKIMTIGAE